MPVNDDHDLTLDEITALVHRAKILLRMQLDDQLLYLSPSPDNLDCARILGAIAADYLSVLDDYLNDLPPSARISYTIPVHHPASAA